MRNGKRHRSSFRSIALEKGNGKWEMASIISPFSFLPSLRPHFQIAGTNFISPTFSQTAKHSAQLIDALVMRRQSFGIEPFPPLANL